MVLWSSSSCTFRPRCVDVRHRAQLGVRLAPKKANRSQVRVRGYWRCASDSCPILLVLDRNQAGINSRSLAFVAGSVGQWEGTPPQLPR